MGFMVCGLWLRFYGFGVQGLGFKVLGSGFEGLKCRFVLGIGFRV